MAELAKYPLQRYKFLQKAIPSLFNNQSAPIKIITDKNLILSWQRKKQNELATFNLPESWSEIGLLLDDPRVLILRDLVKFPDDKLEGYIRLLNLADLNEGQGSAILPIMEEKILLLRHYRHATRQWHWEIPRGFGTPHMSAEENAVKEISEEIGGEVGNIIDIGEYHSNTGIEGFPVRLFFAHITKASHVQTEEGIDRFDLFSASKVEKMILNNEITDGFTIAAYTRAKLRGLLEIPLVQNEWKISKDPFFSEILHIQPPIFHDNRGHFMETFDTNIFRINGIPTNFVLDHESSSKKGTLRGLHYQIKYSQGKLVRVAQGKTFTVIVDMRRNSRTFGKWTHTIISSENKNLLWIPKGFAHGFYVLSESAIVIYKTTDNYAPEWERVLAWDDPSLNIDWPLQHGKYPILSEKDAQGKNFHELEYYEFSE